MQLFRTILLAGGALRGVLAISAHDLHTNTPSLPLGLWRSLKEADQTTSINTVSAKERYPPHSLDVPVDHFDDSNNSTFSLRYWISDEYYKPGGPVFCLEGGETSGRPPISLFALDAKGFPFTGADRIPFLDHGILKILSEATGGLSIVVSMTAVPDLV